MNYFDDLRFFSCAHIYPYEHNVLMPRSLKLTSLNYAHRGTVEFQMDNNKPLILNAPVVFWTLPGTSFRYHATDRTPWDHYYILFFGKRVNRWVRSGLLPSPVTKPFIPIVEIERFRHSFEHILSVLKEAPADSTEVSELRRRHPEAHNLCRRFNPEAVLLLESLLLEMHNQPKRPPACAHRRGDIEELMRALRAHPEQGFDVEKHAAELGMTPKHLRHLFVLFAGCSPLRYLRRVQIDKAAYMLCSSEAPVKAIAEKVGFENVYYFSRVFAKLQGVPPASYRKHHRVMQPSETTTGNHGSI